MLVHQIYTDNSLRNFNYIIACAETKEAIVIDPLRVDLIMDIIEQNNYKVSKIVNTHEHADHTDGNEELVSKTGAKVFCHHNAVPRVPCAEYGLTKDTMISVGKTVEIKVLETPGHTMAHVCLLATNVNNHEQAIFSGDTLFNAGAGHVHSGNIEDLYQTFVNILYTLSDYTLVYPGHDYLENNLNFTLNREPSNTKAKGLLEKIKNQDPHNAYVTNLKTEKDINTFFRLDSKEVIAKLCDDVKGFGHTATKQQVFYALRELRNHW